MNTYAVAARFLTEQARPLERALFRFHFAGGPREEVLREAVEANLDYLIGEQGGDGAWAPTWNWGGLFPEAWPQARRDWQGVLTLDALKVLRAFGRI
jgi:hypothetical protein